MRVGPTYVSRWKRHFGDQVRVRAETLNVSRTHIFFDQTSAFAGVSCQQEFTFQFRVFVVNTTVQEVARSLQRSTAGIAGTGVKEHGMLNANTRAWI